jgi:hypothetical protein
MRVSQNVISELARVLLASDSACACARIAPAGKHTKLILIKGVLEPHDQGFSNLNITIGTISGLLISTHTARAGAVFERSGVVNKMHKCAHRGNKLNILKVD